MRTRFPQFCLKALLVMIGIGMGVAASGWAGEVIMGAGAAATENIFRKIEYPLSRAMNIKITNIPSGPVQAWKDLDAGKVHCAVGGLNFNDWLEMMKKDGYTVSDPSVYKSWVIGQDKVVVMTNPDVPVASLSKEQLAGIFSGRIRNWSEVGGPEKQILVILGNQIPGTMAMFQKNIMGGAEYTKYAMIGTTAEDIKSRVVRNPGAIGFGAVSQIDYLVNSPTTPEVKRDITLITKGAPSQDVVKMIEFINRDGQHYIGK
ncbi:MAG: substrate-binding domain-containing protein [Proteobacteria bacterium]|nr:substrate-binding domain-containing protein [Pseudomonadota bacterium]